MTHPLRRTASAFTLVELLVVIGIIALLISILLPTLNRARAKSQEIKCASNLRQIGIGLEFYHQDNGGWLPAVGQHYNEPDVSAPPPAPGGVFVTGPGYYPQGYPWSFGALLGIAPGGGEIGPQYIQGAIDIDPGTFRIKNLSCPLTGGQFANAVGGPGYGLNNFGKMNAAGAAIFFIGASSPTDPTRSPATKITTIQEAPRVMLSADAFVNVAGNFDQSLNMRRTSGSGTVNPYNGSDPALPTITPGRLWSNTGHDGGANYVFVDGHANYIKGVHPTARVSIPQGFGQSILFDPPNLYPDANDLGGYVVP